MVDMVRRELLTSRRLGALTAATFMFAAGVAGCGTKEQDDRSSAFCTFLSALNAEANSATSAEQGLVMLRSYIPELEQQLPSAPQGMQADITVLLTASRAALDSNDLSPLASDDVAQAGARLSETCGLQPAPPAGQSPEPFASPALG
jgi:hypothetical protein